MKTIKLFVFLLALGLATGCKSDDDNNSQGTLFGTWTLKSVTGGFGGANQQYEPGVITWTFNDDGTVDVVNGQIPDTGYEFFETGTYDYQVLSVNGTADCDGAMIIDATGFGCMDVGTNTLKFDQRDADGFLVTLRKL
ncbi:hypothetical protein [Flavobacterium sp.]|uniref:hypothetical protein n=1 Tax=Flavobacterium sp. TaxID=239 RepID=UPI0011FCBF94|nr:hypothetical protein [Flavobacterium sp.]RZJ69652.1 MAG: hypothetical protein EOO49_16615 [Flavobacterium sp.]